MLKYRYTYLLSFITKTPQRLVCIIIPSTENTKDYKWVAMMFAVKKACSRSPEARFLRIGAGGAFLVTAVGKFNYFAFDSWKFIPY